MSIERGIGLLIGVILFLVLIYVLLKVAGAV